MSGIGRRRYHKKRSVLVSKLFGPQAKELETRICLQNFWTTAGNRPALTVGESRPRMAPKLTPRSSALALCLALLSLFLLYLYSSATSSSQIRHPMASLQPLKYMVVLPKVKHTATVVFLHVRPLLPFRFSSLCIIDSRRVLATRAQDGNP